MRRDIETFKIRETEFRVGATVAALELARAAAQIWRLQAISTGTEFDAIHPAVNFLLDYTGNLSLGYLFTWVGKDYMPKLPKKWGLNRLSSLDKASLAVFGGAVVLETLQGFTYGDIPAAAIGIYAYRRLNKYLRSNLPSDPKKIP